MTLFFNAISDAYLSLKIKNSLEWILVMGITIRCRIVGNRKRISEIEDT